MNPGEQLQSVDQALHRVLDAVKPLCGEVVPLEKLLGRYLAEDCFAGVPIPGFDNSAMDGFAVRSEECQAGKILRVTGEQLAGQRNPELKVATGCAVRIFTGAPVPDGADAVIMQEDTEEVPDGILVREGVVPGENIRKQGTEVCAGQLLLRKGERVNSAAVGLLGAEGFEKVPVTRCPAVTVLTTGDEVVPPGTPLRDGMIYNSNGPMVRALVEGLGISDIHVLHAPDEIATLRAAVEAGLRGDVLIICGGVSVGARDLVKVVLSDLGVPPVFWRVAVKPGKPFLFSQSADSLVFGLPGNPVSAFVTFQLFVRPALLRQMGAMETEPVSEACQLGATVANPGDRIFCVRGSLRKGIFHPAARQASHSIAALAQSNAMLTIPPGNEFKEGEWVHVVRFE